MRVLALVNPQGGFESRWRYLRKVSPVLEIPVVWATLGCRDDTVCHPRVGGALGARARHVDKPVSTLTR